MSKSALQQIQVDGKGRITNVSSGLCRRGTSVMWEEDALGVKRVVLEPSDSPVVYENCTFENTTSATRLQVNAGMYWQGGGTWVTPTAYSGSEISSAPQATYHRVCEYCLIKNAQSTRNCDGCGAPCNGSLIRDY